MLTRRHRNGAWRSYPIAPEALGAALGNLPLASGLLPPETLGFGVAQGDPFYVLYVPPRRAALPVVEGTTERVYDLTTPPLIWAGCGLDYRVWALGREERPTRGNALLWVAPFPNCYKEGGICWGSAERPPKAAAETLEAALALFLVGSRFNSHLANYKSVAFPANVMAHYARLAPDQPYPLDDLMPAERQLGWLLAGGPWGGTQ